MEKKYVHVKFRDYETRIPYYIIEGKKFDQSVFFSGGMHGNEVNGMFQIKRFLNWIKEDHIESKIRGTVYVFPVLNPSGFKKMKRRIAEDNRDLNRSFGIEEPQTYSNAHANALVEVFKHSSLGIDLHDAGGLNQLTPHTRIHRMDKIDCQSCSREVAQWVGLDFTLQRKASPGMLGIHMQKNYGTSVVTVEIGGGGEIYHQGDDIALNGMQNVLKKAGMLDGDPVMPKKQYFGNDVDRTWYRLPKPYIFEFYVKNGDLIKKGDVIGYKYNPISGNKKDIVARSDGMVFAVNENNQARRNDKVLSVIKNVFQA